MTQTDKDTMALLTLCLVLLFYQADSTLDEGWDTSYISKDGAGSSHSLPLYSDKRLPHGFLPFAKEIPLKDYIDVLKKVPIFRSVPYIKHVPIWGHIPLWEEHAFHGGHLSVFKEIPTVDHASVLDHVSVIEKVPITVLSTFDHDIAHTKSLIHSKHPKPDSIFLQPKATDSIFLQPKATDSALLKPKDTDYVHHDDVPHSEIEELSYSKEHDAIIHGTHDVHDHGSLRAITPITEVKSAKIVKKHEEVSQGDLLEAEPKIHIESIVDAGKSDVISHGDISSIDAVIPITHEEQVEFDLPEIHHEESLVSKDSHHAAIDIPVSHAKYHTGYTALLGKKNCGQRWTPITKDGRKLYGFFSSGYSNGDHGLTSHYGHGAYEGLTGDHGFTSHHEHETYKGLTGDHGLTHLGHDSLSLSRDPKQNHIIGSLHEISNPGYNFKGHSQHHLPETVHHSISHHDGIVHDSFPHGKHEGDEEIIEDGGHLLHEDHDDHPILEHKGDTGHINQEHEEHFPHGHEGFIEEHHGDHLFDKHHSDHLVDEHDEDHSLDKHHGDHLIDKHHDDHLLDKHHDDHLLDKHHDDHLLDKHHDDHLIDKHHDDHLIGKHHGDHLIDKHHGDHLIDKHHGDHLFDKHHGDHLIEKHEGHHLLSGHEGDHLTQIKEEHEIPEHTIEHKDHDYHDEKHQLSHEHHHTDSGFKHGVPEHKIGHKANAYHDDKHQSHEHHHADSGFKHGIPDVQLNPNLAHDVSDHLDHNYNLHNIDNAKHEPHKYDKKDHASGYEHAQHEGGDRHHPPEHANPEHQYKDNVDYKAHEQGHPQEFLGGKHPTPASHKIPNQPPHHQYEEQKHVGNDYENQRNNQQQQLHDNGRQTYKEGDKGTYEQKPDRPDSSRNRGYEEDAERKYPRMTAKGRILYWYFRKYHGRRYNNKKDSRVAAKAPLPALDTRKTYEGPSQTYSQEKYSAPKSSIGEDDRNRNYGVRIKLDQYKKQPVDTSGHKYVDQSYQDKSEYETNPKYDTKLDLSAPSGPQYQPEPQSVKYGKDKSSDYYRQTAGGKSGNNRQGVQPESGGVQSNYFRKYHRGVGSRIYGDEYAVNRNRHGSRNYQNHPQFTSQRNSHSPVNSHSIRSNYNTGYERPRLAQYSSKFSNDGYGKEVSQQPKSSYYKTDPPKIAQPQLNRYRQNSQYSHPPTTSKGYGKDGRTQGAIANTGGVQQNYFRKYHQGLGAPIHGGLIKPMRGGAEQGKYIPRVLANPSSLKRNIPQNVYRTTQQKIYDEDDDDDSDSYNNGPLPKHEYERSQHQSSYTRGGHQPNNYKVEQQRQYSYPPSPPAQEKYDDDLDSDEFNRNGASQQGGLKSNYFRKYHQGLGAPIHGGNYRDNGYIRTMDTNSRKL